MVKTFRVRRIAALLMTFMMIFAYSVIPANQVFAAAKKPTKMTITSTAKTVDIKGKITVSVRSVTPKNASKAVTFRTSNKKIATVTSKGVVTGRKKGTVTITVTSKANKKLRKTVRIKVKQIAPSVKLNKTSAVMSEGNTLRLTATMPAGVYNKGMTWSTSDETVAMVSGGTVTALKPGTVTIKAVSKENRSKTASCKITVLSKAITPAELKAGLAAGTFTVLDVRKAADYEDGHIPTSISADVDGAVSGNDADTAEKNIKAAIEGSPADTDYVLICYTGIKYAQAATELLMQNGVSNADIFTLTDKSGTANSGGGMTAWNAAKYPVNNKYLTVDVLNRTVELKGRVNSRYFTDSTRHLMIDTAGYNAGRAILDSYAGPEEVYNALAFIGGVSWSKSADKTLGDGELITEDNAENKNYSHLEAGIVSGDTYTELSGALTTVCGSTDPADAPKIDMVFSGNPLAAAKEPSGCIACLDSCFIGIVSNDEYGLCVIDHEQPAVYARSDVFPADGDVSVVFTLREM